MQITLKRICDLLVRKDVFESQVRDLEALLGADSSLVRDVVGAGEAYSERATRAFIDEVLSAYTACADAESLDPAMYEDTSCVEDDDPDYYTTALGDPGKSYLDRTQAQLLSSMLYCLVRLVAESPWYDGTFGELEAACDQLLDSFGHNVERKALWVDEIEARELGATPCKPSDVSGTTDMVISFPELGEHGYLRFNDDWPVWFLSDLNSIYEMLSGKLIGDSIPAKERKAIASDPHNFMHLKDEGVSYGFSREMVDRAYELGWIGEEDVKTWETMHKGGDAILAERSEDPDMVEIDNIRQMRADRFARRIEQWVETFPKKNVWCREYLNMRAAYFELEGLDPIDDEMPVAMQIEARWLIGGIEGVLDARGISHYNDDVYIDACSHLSQAIDSIRQRW